MTTCTPTETTGLCAPTQNYEHRVQTETSRCVLYNEAVDEETISAQSHRSEKHLGVALTELLPFCYIMGTMDANANFLSFSWESPTTHAQTHPAKKTLCDVIQT